MENIDFEIIEKRKTKARKVKAWTEHEDRQLKSLYENHPRQWGIISSLIPDRNQNQCLHRYRRLIQRGMDHTKNWSEEEDDVVQKLIKRIGKNWKLIAQMLGSKTGKQIRERYINKLDPTIKKIPWTKQEDIQLIKCIKQFGSKWSEISKNIPGRPENMIKNRFYSFIKKNYEIRDKLKLQQAQSQIVCIQQKIESSSIECKKQKGQQNQQIPLIPSILEIEQQPIILKEIQNIDMVDIKTFNQISEQDLFYFLNTRQS